MEDKVAAAAADGADEEEGFGSAISGIGDAVRVVGGAVIGIIGGPGVASVGVTGLLPPSMRLASSGGGGCRDWRSLSRWRRMGRGRWSSGTRLRRGCPKMTHHVDPQAAGLPVCSPSEYLRPACVNKCFDATCGVPHAHDKRFASSTSKLSTVEEIQADLMEHGPVTAAFSVYEDFLMGSVLAAILVIVANLAAAAAAICGNVATATAAVVTSLAAAAAAAPTAHSFCGFARAEETCITAVLSPTCFRLCTHASFSGFFHMRDAPLFLQDAQRTQ
ncbi:unnamed protein product [Phaeothamnion confervicola]